jgi:hypothetical protein
MSVHHSRYLKRRARERSAALLLVFSAMVFVFAAGAILAFYFVPNPSLLLGRQAAPTTGDSIVEVRMQGRPMHLPEALIERVDRQFLGGVQRIDLRLPPPPSDDRLEGLAAPGEEESGQPILTIAPIGDGKLPQDRFEEIYSVYLEPASKAEAGLIRHTFRTGSPYADSELFSVEGTSPIILFRCDVTHSALGPPLCETHRRLPGDLAVRIRFEREALGDWRGITGRAETLLKQIGAE